MVGIPYHDGHLSLHQRAASTGPGISGPRPPEAASTSALGRLTGRSAARLGVSDWASPHRARDLVRVARHPTAPGGTATALGRLTGLVGTYLMLVSLLLVARFPWLERAAGQERLVRWHRWLGPWPIFLIVAHAVLITVGYAAAAAGGILPMAWNLVTVYPNVLAASVALGLLVLAGVTSWRVLVAGCGTRRGGRSTSTSTWRWRWHLPIRSARSGLRRLPGGACLVDRDVGRDRWCRACVPLRTPAVAVGPARLARRRGTQRGAGNDDRDHEGIAAGPAAGSRRSVPELALPPPRPHRARAPLLIVRDASR